MDKETPTFCADRMQFIVAAMTKDYDKAKGIANTILKAEPGNKTLQYYLNMLEKETNKRKKIDNDGEVTETESEASIDTDSDNADSSTDTSSDSDNSSQNIADDKKERDFIKPRRIQQGFEKKESVFDSGGAKTSRCEAKFRHNDFRGKIIRVFPIRLSEKMNVTK